MILLTKSPRNPKRLPGGPQEATKNSGQKSLQYFCCYFGLNNDTKKTFRNQLTFIIHTYFILPCKFMASNLVTGNTQFFQRSLQISDDIFQWLICCSCASQINWYNSVFHSRFYGVIKFQKKLFPTIDNLFQVYLLQEFKNTQEILPSVWTGLALFERFEQFQALIFSFWVAQKNHREISMITYFCNPSIK